MKPSGGLDRGLRPRGSNHAGMAQFNERVVLQAIRQNGSVSKADIARLTSLTPQTIQIIIARLEGEGLVHKLEPQRGKVGQPSVPMALNPDGAFSIGIKIGRRSLDMLLLDFAGRVRQRSALGYAFPDPDELFGQIKTGLRQLTQSLPVKLRPRLHGVGIAAPLSLGGWQALLGIPAKQAEKWARIDIRGRVAAMTELPVGFVKDTAAACVAELVAGRGRSIRSFLYVFVDTFIGGGIQPLRLKPRLEVEQRGLAQELHGRLALPRLREAGPAVAFAVNSAACLLDLDGVIIDGSFSRELLAATLDSVNHALDDYNWEGVARPVVLEGTIGSDARAIGGALLPLYANFAPDRELFLKLAG